jgi:hypothetical protein
MRRRFTLDPGRSCLQTKVVLTVKVTVTVICKLNIIAVPSSASALSYQRFWTRPRSLALLMSCD